MSYQPRNVPSDPAALSEYLRAELNRLAQELETAQSLLRVAQSSVTPAKPRTGDIRYADGSNWGAQNGFYFYDSTAWQPLGLSLGNAGYGWRDQLGSAAVRGNPSNSPTWSAYRGSIYQLEFPTASGEKEMQFEFHIQHDFMVSADATALGITPELHLHLHTSQNVADAGKNIRFYADISYSKGHNQAAFSAPVTATIDIATSSTQYQHLITEVQIAATSPSASQIDYDDLEPDGVLLVRVYRDAGDAADTATQTVFLHFADLHYMTGGRFGTRNKSPSFYADPIAVSTGVGALTITGYAPSVTVT